MRRTDPHECVISLRLWGSHVGVRTVRTAAQTVRLIFCSSTSLRSAPLGHSFRLINCRRCEHPSSSRLLEDNTERTKRRTFRDHHQ